MEKIQRNKDPFMFKIQYLHIKNFKSWPFVYIPLIILSSILYAIKLYQLIHPSFEETLKMPNFTIFIAEIIFLAAVAILGGISVCVTSFNNVFTYALLLAEALGMIFVQTTMQCFYESKWCQNDIKYQVGAIMVLSIYGIVIYLRSSLYYPFYDNFIYISMSSSMIVIFDFAYKLALGIITNILTIDEIDTQRKMIILATIFLYSIYVGRNFYCNPKIQNCWLVVNTFLAWTALVIYLLPYLDVISTMDLSYASDNETLFWYIWGYSTPCLICYVVIANFAIDAKNGWMQLFLEDKHQIKNLDHLYLMASQLKQKLKIVKKSEQKTNDPLFKQIWKLVGRHNEFCDHHQCPLAELKSIQIQRNDDFLEQKRLAKAIQSCFLFGLYHLERKKDLFPNLLQLSIQISNYELEIFQNRQKGLLLYTQFYNREDIDSNQKFMLYYLKKKIEELFIDNENYTKTNTQNQISEFRHNIEVSVSMLAEFWYFLADPKCNLKKLYDLANVLFPLKIGVDNEWQNIQKLKSIESYNLYARYLIKMFNDKEKGLKILEEAKKIELELKNREEIQFDTEGNGSIGVEENGIIFLQFDGKNPGVMYQVNLAAERIFGYSKGELMNRKVNDIMPKLFANYHDKILENYQQTNKAKMMNKQRAIWGKSKDGYLFPCNILIKPVKNLLSQSNEVYACVKRETWVKESAFLTLDMQEQINQVSSAMLGIYPELYGKVNLKKKMLITELIPKFSELKQKMIDDKECLCEFQVQREYQINQKDKFKETTTFNLSLQQINITIAGHVGYLLKFQKTIIANAIKELALSHIKESQLKQNHFRFIYQIVEAEEVGSEENKAMIKFKAGIVNDIQEMARSCVRSASKFFKKLPVEQEKQFQQRQKIDYGITIKTKRLQSKQIREIHIISEQSQFDIGQIQKEIQQNLGNINIKPSELSSILQKQISNKHIFCLKLITFIILMISSLFCIVEYVNLWSEHVLMIQSNQKVRKIHELGCQILYIKMFTIQFSISMRTEEELELFTDQINNLDEYLDLYSYGTQTKLTYNDGSSQTMLLGFGITKLVSQANSVKASPRVYSQNSSHVYFVNYNTINGLILSIKNQSTLALQSYYKCLDRIQHIEIIYAGIAVSLFATAMIVKNILLRVVLKKKSQILEVFFQIPRKACTSIQKQCQRFIQRLSSQNHEDLQQMSMASQGSEAGLGEQKKQHKQKKRTVMGEQKTTNHYIVGTIFFLVILLFFHVFVALFHNVEKENMLFAMSASDMIYRIEQQASIILNLMNSFALDTETPLLGRPTTESYKVITQEFYAFSDLYGQMAMQFYLMGNLLDDAYLQDYNDLSYQNLCIRTNDTSCDIVYGEQFGLNVVLSQYFNVVKNKYIEIRDSFNSAADFDFDLEERQKIIKVSRLQGERQSQFILKQHWRELTKTLKNGLGRLIKYNDTIMFGLMLAMCISNCTLVLFCWFKFYNNLQQKIAATEYILTFIPIDEINRNPKIANYIKQQILEKR